MRSEKDGSTLYDRVDSYITSDAAFGVKDSLIVDIARLGRQNIYLIRR